SVARRRRQRRQPRPGWPARRTRALQRSRRPRRTTRRATLGRALLLRRGPVGHRPVRRRRRDALHVATRGIARPAKSGNVHSGGGAGDDEALDLGSALEERVDLRIAVPLLDREVADVAVATEDLDGLLGDPDRDLARLELA